MSIHVEITSHRVAILIDISGIDIGGIEVAQIDRVVLDVVAQDRFRGDFGARDGIVRQLIFTHRVVGQEIGCKLEDRVEVVVETLDEGELSRLPQGPDKLGPFRFEYAV